jgi:hypothetical protein
MSERIFHNEVETGQATGGWTTWPLGPAAWQREIRQSGLSTQIQSMLQSVMRRCPLLPWEKREVIRELIAHFQDGCDRGHSDRDMLDDFGDPLLAARLIGKAKRRNRTMKDRLLQGSLWMGALTLTGFLGLMVTFYWGQPNPQTDFLTQVNRRAAAAPADQSAWLIYRDVWAKYGFCEGTSEIGSFIEIHLQNPDADDHLRLVRPSDGPAWQAAIQKLSDSQDLLDALRAGGRRPYLGLPLQSDLLKYSREDFVALFPNRDYDQLMAEANRPDSGSGGQSLPMFEIMLPHVQTMRKVARILTVDTHWALEQGDHERATQNLEAIFGIARQASENGFLVGSLVGIAINSMGCDLVESVVLSASPGLDESQLARIQAAIQRSPIQEMGDLSSERAAFMDMVQRCYTDDGNGDGRITAQGLRLLEEVEQMGASHFDRERTSRAWEGTRFVAAPASLLVMASRKQLTEKANELFDMSEQAIRAPFHDAAFEEFEKEIKQLGFAYLPIGLLFPGSKYAHEAFYRGQAQQAGTIAALAVLRYQERNGHLPESLEDLVDEFLEEVPMDPLRVNQPLGYVRLIDPAALARQPGASPADATDPTVPPGFRIRQHDTGVPETFRIYSVGRNGQDHGGQVVWHVPTAMDTDPPVDPDDDPDARPLPASHYRLIGDSAQAGDWIIWPRYAVR